MNLIEQLGSYEESKKILYGYKNFGWKTQAVEMHFGFGFTIKDLDVALLEHRRQHNIFEESDKIVFIDDFMHGELMTVAWTRKGEVWMDEGAKRCTDLSMIRHATPEEIKAGRRL